MARDGEDVLPEARTALYVTGRREELAVVLLHGLTNGPAQYSAFAPLLFRCGVNVVVPRMPEHGYRDRMTTRIARLNEKHLLRTADEAIAVASGLGRSVGVLGISMGALLAAHYAQFSPLGVAVLVAPNFALLRLPYWASRSLAGAMRTLPNAFLWWDPRVRGARPPFAAYPRFPTRVLGRSMSVGEKVYAAARRFAPHTRRIVTIVNHNDPAVNNAVTERVTRQWSRRQPERVRYVELENLPRHHDIVDPEQPLARTELVYPRLLEALGLAPQM